MKKNSFYVCLFFCTSLFFTACIDDPYPYNDKEPGEDKLGKSIYDFLEHDGNFTNYLRLVNSVQDAGTNYAEVLSKTGTKTVFVADDEAYEAFFNDNPYGIRKFEDFTEAQRRAILFSGMLDDAYLMEMLANTPGNPPNKGQAMRRYTSWQVLDNVKYETAAQLPDNPSWMPYREQGIYILNDNSQWTMVHFLDAQMRANDVTPEDFNYLTRTLENPGGVQWNLDDAYIFNVKIVKKDVTCKNGYINVLEKFQLPPGNMAEHIRESEDSRLFNRFIERFCAPYYDATNTLNYRQINSDFLDKRLYVKRFFTETNSYLPDENGIPSISNKAPALLKFDPGNNLASSPISVDMAAMFVPTDEALTRFFNEGSGLILQERYGTWDDVPDDVMNVLLNNHMWRSFLQTTPGRFEKIENQMGTSLNVKKEDLKYTTICSNGVVYHTNRVYTPAEYASVLAPVILGEATKIMYWAVNELRFHLYLLSLENQFSFIVPTDDVFNNYISPISVGRGDPERWRFYFPRTNVLEAVRYNMDGDSIGVERNSDNLRNALNDIVNNHIVVGDIEDGKTYYQTKGGGTIKISGRGIGMALDGGGNSERNETAKVVRVYNQENGKTFLIDKVVQMPTRSVYSILQSDPRFGKFFELCLAVHPVIEGGINYGGGSIFYINNNFVGITENVAFFNTYHYTVYAPTNEAMEQAWRDGRYKMPADITGDNSLSTAEKGKEMQRLYEFLRYHFQDNSIYIGGNSYSDAWFETATMNPDTDKFRRVYVTNNANSLSVRSENGTTANVITGDGLYNLMARDYLFNNKLIQIATRIETSSFAVIHQIDAVLDFQTR